MRIFFLTFLQISIMKNSVLYGFTLHTLTQRKFSYRYLSINLLTYIHIAPILKSMEQYMMIKRMISRREIKGQEKDALFRHKNICKLSINFQLTNHFTWFHAVLLLACSVNMNNNFIFLYVLINCKMR